MYPSKTSVQRDKNSDNYNTYNGYAVIDITCKTAYHCRLPDYNLNSNILGYNLWCFHSC